LQNIPRHNYSKLDLRDITMGKLGQGQEILSSYIRNNCTKYEVSMTKAYIGYAKKIL
jgi:hypothetical protein